MTLTETRPDTEASSGAASRPATTLDGLLGSSDHKTIGRLWIGVGLVFLAAGLVVSLVAAFEAADLSSFAIVDDTGQFAQLWSLGRVLVLFGGVVPVLVGLATYLVPLQIGAPAIVFARGASGAFWTWFISLDLVIVSYLLNGGPGGGRADFVVLWAAGLAFALAALVWAMVVVATTVLGARTTGMSLDRAPMATWSFLVFSLIGVLSLPILIAELALTYVRVRHGFLPPDASTSLTGVMDSVSLTPALYWLAVPILGMAVDIIGVHTDRPVQAHKQVMAAIGALGILGFGAQYLSFASVRPVDFDNALLVITIAAAGLPMLAVLGLSGESLRRGTPRMGASLIGALVAGLLLLLSVAVSLLGLIKPVAVFLENETPVSVALDRLLILNGTTFHDGVRGLIIGATVVGTIAALTHWAPKLWGRRMAEPLSLLAIMAAAGGAVVWGLGAVLAGVDDQPAYPQAELLGGENVEFFNLIAAVGIAILAAGAVLATLNAAQAAFGKAESASGRVWTGATLEWATATPPAVGNFERSPVVRSATPLLDDIDGGDGGAPETAASDEAAAGGEEESR